TPEALAKLDRLRRGFVELHDGSDASELAWLSLAAILRPTSFVGTAQWQYVLPKKEKKRTVDPFDAFDSLARQVVRDMRLVAENGEVSSARILQTDARTCAGVPDRFASLVITSPPY